MAQVDRLVPSLPFIPSTRPIPRPSIAYPLSQVTDLSFSTTSTLTALRAVARSKTT